MNVTHTDLGTGVETKFELKYHAIVIGLDGKTLFAGEVESTPKFVSTALLLWTEPETVLAFANGHWVSVTWKKL